VECIGSEKKNKNSKELKILKNSILSMLSKKIDIAIGNLQPREAWLEKNLTLIEMGKRILDAGAGELQYKKYCEHLDYVSQDFAAYDGQGDGIGLQMGQWENKHIDIISDITNIPEPDSSFDAIMCVEVLEHLVNPIRAIAELTRLLKPDGILLITSPFNSLTHFSPFYYYSGFSKYFYEYWLKFYGFDIVDLQLNGNFFTYLAQEVRRLPKVLISYSQKRLNIVEAISRWVLLLALIRFSKSELNSSQLLCFGIHIKAIKRSSLSKDK
jgi:SAM-dependent methyltransferase